MATLGELVASEGEYLGAPQRAELADGEDHAVGRPRLRRPPVAAWLDDRGGLAFAGSPAFVPDPGLARLGLAGLGPELRRHGLARRQASAKWQAAYGQCRRQACTCPPVVQ